MAGQNSFNVGRDGAQFTIIDSVAGRVTFGGVVGFDAKSRAKELESEGIDGNVKFRNVPAGWEGTFTFDREDASVDAYFATLESNFYAGLPPPTGIITHTVNELSGAVSQFQYTGVVLKLSDAGNWKGLDKVSLSVGWKASKRIPLVIGA